MLNLFRKKGGIPTEEPSGITTTDHFFAVFNALSIPICILDEKNRISYCNEAMSRYFGKSVSEITGQFFSRIIDGAYTIPDPIYIKKMKESGKAVTEIVELNGRWFEITVSPLAGFSGAKPQTVQITREIPGVKAIENEMISKHLHNRFRNFTGMLYVDLMNCLMSISGYLQLLERKADDSEKRDRYFKAAFKAVESMTEFIKKMREMRIDPDV
jgi:PAS domain S-box-containing protein